MKGNRVILSAHRGDRFKHLENTMPAFISAVEYGVDYKENFDYCNKNDILPCLCIADTLESYQLAINYGCKMFTSNNIYLATDILKRLKVR